MSPARNANLFPPDADRQLFLLTANLLPHQIAPNCQVCHALCTVSPAKLEDLPDPKKMFGILVPVTYLEMESLDVI